MKTIILALTFLYCLPSFAQRDQQSASSLEGEFYRQVNIRKPYLYSGMEGLPFGLDHVFFQEKNDQLDEELNDDLFGDVTGLSFSVGPLVYGTKEKIRRKVNKEISEREDMVVEFASDASPFVLTESRRWDLGGGFSVFSKLPVPLELAGASIAALKGKNYYSLRHFSGPEEEREPLRWPDTPENLRTWKVGDQLFYAARGGVIFNVFLGFGPFLRIGPEYIHSGSYRIRVERLSQDLMEVGITTTKTDSIGLEAVNIPLKFEIAKGKGHINDLVYHFDLKDPQAQKAMALLFQGRLDLTNREMLSGGKIAVSTKMQHTYTSFLGNFGLPVIWSITGTIGHSRSEGTIEKEEDGVVRKYDIITSTIHKEYFTKGLFSAKKWFSHNITSTIIRDSEKKGSAITSLYSWSLCKKNMNSSFLLRKLKKLGEVFSLKRMKEIELPAKRLGYLKADFLVSFSTNDILHLLNTQNLEELEERAISQLSIDFRTLGHRKFCKVRKYDDCLERHIRKIRQKKGALLEKIHELERAYQVGELRKVTTRLSNIYSTLFSSKYLTRAYSEERPELFFELRLEGEKIKRHFFKL